MNPFETAINLVQMLWSVFFTDMKHEGPNPFTVGDRDDLFTMKGLL